MEELLVLIFGLAVNKQFGVSRLASGTGWSTAAAVYIILPDWTVADRVKAARQKVL